MPKYTVRFVNHFYTASETFATLADALTFARSTGFDSAIERDGELVAGWGSISGLRFYSDTERAAHYDAERREPVSGSLGTGKVAMRIAARSQAVHS